MKSHSYIRVLVVIISLVVPNLAHGQVQGYLKGTIRLDSTWEQKIYLSHIPTFEDMYSMSRDMILANADIDSAGSFTFDLSFLPETNNLFRLHLVKKGDSPSSLIIGGNDENHLFLCASKYSKILLLAGKSIPPFSEVKFENSAVNRNFQIVTELVHTRTSIAAESDAAKRRFIENDLKAQLAAIADTTSDHLLGLYALYNRNSDIDYAADPDLYDAFNSRFAEVSGPYLQSFRNKLPAQPNSNTTFWVIAGGLFLLISGFLIGRWPVTRERTSPDISKLSIQERKIFDLLRQGASNQDISEECNIGVSTVKSHVSSIYSKLKINSRKDVMNLP